MTTSVFVMNLAWVLLLVWWLCGGHWHERWERMKRNRLLQAFLLLALVHVVWLAGTQDWVRAGSLLLTRLPMLAVPLVVLTSPPLKTWEQWIVGGVYCATVLVVSLIGYVRYLTMPDVPYRQIVPYISHIRYGLNACLTIFLLVYGSVRYRRRWLLAVNGIAALWLLYVLLLLHAYTAFAILLLTPIVSFIVYRERLSRGVRMGVGGLIGMGIVALAMVSLYYVRQYYPPRHDTVYPVATVNGNAYDLPQDDFMENGYPLYYVVCTAELRQQWPRYSDYPYDSVTAVGYPLSAALLRYLNAMGVTKDSVGLTHLTADDIAAIEEGVGNPVYRQFGLRRLYYSLFYEYDCYRYYHSIVGFTMLQRIELWRNAWQVFLRHPVLGVGMGDAMSQGQAHLRQTGSPLATADLNTHNQYLNFLVTFGAVGCLLILLAFLRGWCRQGTQPSGGHSWLFTAYLCILLISFLTEDTLNTAAGVLFATVPMVLLYSSPPAGYPSHT